MTNLDGTSDENLVVDTPAFAASPSTNPCLVYLNMFPRLAADTILIGRTMPARSLWRMPKAVS